MLPPSRSKDITALFVAVARLEERIIVLGREERVIALGGEIKALKKWLQWCVTVIISLLSLAVAGYAIAATI